MVFATNQLVQRVNARLLVCLMCGVRGLCCTDPNQPETETVPGHPTSARTEKEWLAFGVLLRLSRRIFYRAVQLRYHGTIFGKSEERSLEVRPLELRVGAGSEHGNNAQHGKPAGAGPVDCNYSVLFAGKTGPRDYCEHGLHESAQLGLQSQRRVVCGSALTIHTSTRFPANGLNELCGSLRP